jgi:hypothetical protein
LSQFKKVLRKSVDKHAFALCELLFKHLYKVKEQSAFNKMTINALAVYWSACLFPAKADMEFSTQLLIEDAAELFDK